MKKAKQEKRRDVKKNNSPVIVERNQDLLWALIISFFVVRKRAFSLLCVFICVLDPLAHPTIFLVCFVCITGIQG